jgi:O-antigen ligase/tetratricopeptide (TPR) repeat protein
MSKRKRAEVARQGDSLRPGDKPIGPYGETSHTARMGRQGETASVSEVLSSKLLDLVLVGIILLMAALGGGMLYDRVTPTPGYTSITDLIGVPVAVALSSLLLLKMVWNGVDVTKPRAATICFGLFAFWAAFSLLQSHNRYISGMMLVIVLGCGALCAAVARIAKTPSSAFTVAAFIAGAATVVATIGIHEYLLRFREGNALWRVFGGFVNPDFLAGFLLIAVPIAAALLLSAGHRKLSLSPEAAVGICACAIGLLITYLYFIAVAARLIPTPMLIRFSSPVLMRLLAAIEVLAVAVLWMRKEALAQWTPLALRFLSATALLSITICLLLTASRLGLLALVVELIVFGFLALRSRSRNATGRRTIMLAGLIVCAGLVLAGGPILRRVVGSGSEAHSGNFRILTWRGTSRMARANAVLGTGIGTFETAYPVYAVVGFTQHAHNSFLQLAGETGVPGALLLLGAIISSTVLAFRRPKQVSTEIVTEEQGAPDDRPSYEIELLLAGCAAAIVGAVIHNFFDSDLYIPATALLLAAIIGLVFALQPAPSVEPSKIETRKSKIALRTLGAAFALLLVVHGVVIAGGRVQANDAADAYDTAQILIAETMKNSDPGKAEAAKSGITTAIEGYKNAIGLDGHNVEYLLSLASLYQSIGQNAEAEDAYKRAVGMEALGKAYYRYAKFLNAQGRPAEAVAMHQKAAQIEPNNLQNLLALAKSANAAGNVTEAERVYRHINALYHSDFGKVRALPELVDWEFGVAGSYLAEILIARGDKAGAEPLLKESAAILKESWDTRKLEIALLRITKDVRREISDRYDWDLTQLDTLLDAQGNKQEADGVRKQLAEFRQERAVYDAESKAAAALNTN